MDRTCEHCEKRLDWRHRSDARFCTPKCRQYHWRRQRAAKPAVPAAMKQRARWVVSGANKAPLQTNGRAAATNRPETWTTYRRASAQGLPGFVLNADGIVCVDLDGCIGLDGQLATEALRLIGMAGHTFIEVSRSGKGLHIWGRGSVPRNRRLKISSQKVEIYGTGQYIAVTGDAWSESPTTLNNIQPLLEYISQH